MSEAPHSRLAVVGGTVITPEAAIEDGVLLLEDGRVRFAGRARDAGPEPGSAKLTVLFTPRQSRPAA